MVVSVGVNNMYDRFIKLKPTQEVYGDIFIPACFTLENSWMEYTTIKDYEEKINWICSVFGVPKNILEADIKNTIKKTMLEKSYKCTCSKRQVLDRGCICGGE